MPTPRSTGEGSVLVMAAGSASGQLEEVLEFDIGNAPAYKYSSSYVVVVWGLEGQEGRGDSNIEISNE